MAQVRQTVADSLQWVKAELDQSVLRVRQGLETYLENMQDTLPLQRAVVELHQVRGTLTMVRCQGAALLAGEMKNAVQDILQSPPKSPEALFEGLLGATLQISDYLDLLSHGVNDNSLVFQPQINEMRVARGKPVISETALFLQHMAMEGVQPVLPDLRHRPQGQAQAAARKFLPAYQTSLLQWIKEQEVELNLRRLGKIAEQITASTRNADVYQLWWLFAAVVEGLLSQGVQASLETKRLFGQAGQQLKALAEQGEDDGLKVPADISYSLLYLVGRSSVEGPRVKAVVATYALDELLPPASQVDNIRTRLRGPNTQLLQKLSDALKEDISTVKDAIDLLVRAGDKAPIQLDNTIVTVDRIADTLGMLGLEMLQRVVLNQSKLIEELKERESHDEKAWMDVAVAILRVETSLDDALYQQLRRSTSADPSLPMPETISSADLHGGEAAIWREALVNIARIKVQIRDYMDNGELTMVAEIARQLNEITAGFEIQGYERGAELTRHIKAFVLSQAMEGIRQDSVLSNRLADAVVNLEYYLEALQNHQPRADTLVEDIAPSIEQLKIPTTPPHAPTGAAAREAAKPAAPAASTPHEVDPEIREVFLEEAGEVLAEMQGNFASWQQNIGEMDVLRHIRRSFHTLKGSGRMVGAHLIGEFGWAHENMLNKCLDGSIPVSNIVVDCVKAAIAGLPELIRDFHEGTANAHDFAHKLIESAAIAARGESASGADADLLKIFRKDAKVRLGEVEQCLAQAGTQLLPHVDPAIIRAFHTLKGSGESVNASKLARLSGQLEHFSESVRTAGRAFSGDELKLMEDAVRALNDLLDAMSNPTMLEPDLKLIFNRLDLMQSAIPLEVADAATDHELVIIFTDEACEILDQAQDDVNAWAQSPRDTHHPIELKRLFHCLKGSARTAQAPGIGEVAEQMEKQVTRFSESSSGQAAPPEFLKRMDQVISDLYDLLDRFRTGERALPVDPLLALLRGDEAPATAAKPVMPAVPAVETEFEAEAAEEEQVVAETIAATAAEPVAEIVAERVEAVSEESPATAELQMPEPELVAEVPAEALAVEMPPVDEITEVLELEMPAPPAEDVEAIEPEGSAVPESDELVLELPMPVEETEASVLSVAAQPEIMEIDLEAPADAEEALALEMPPAIEIDEAAVPPAPAAESAELDELSLELSLTSEQSAADAMAIEKALEVPEEAVMSMPAPVEAPLAAPAAQAFAPDEDVDPELVEIFAGEAQELLEEIDRQLAHWESEPVAIAPRRELLRSLHTLKGSARMAHVMAMGNLSHELESQITAIERGNRHADPAFLGGLRHAIDAMHGMLDKIQKGDVHIDASAIIAQLRGEEVPVPTPVVAPVPPPVAKVAAPAPVAPKPVAPAPVVTPVIPAPVARPVVPPIVVKPTPVAPPVAPTLAAPVMTAVPPPVARPAVPPVTIAPTPAAPPPITVTPVIPTPVPKPAAPPAPPVIELPEVAELIADAPEELAAAAAAATAEPLQEITPPPAIDTGPWAPALFTAPAQADSKAGQSEVARIQVELLDSMLNEAGEISIYRSRLEQQNTSLQFQLSEMLQTITRVRNQVRNLDTEAQAMIVARQQGQAEQDPDRYKEEFDPLEMDRYSRLQEMSRSLAESMTDLESVRDVLDELRGQNEVLLLQQARVNSELQQKLMRSLMVPFARQVQRLERIVRQTSQEYGKKARIEFAGVESELDRNVLERMVSPLEHLLRNAIAHGIEKPDDRLRVGKPEAGAIMVSLSRDGPQLVIDVSDDGRGLNLPAIRKKAVDLGLIPDTAVLSEADTIPFIFEPGFSTANEVTQVAGRGVGMDVVNAEIKQLGGSVEVRTAEGKGAHFIVRLPLSLAIAQALLIHVAEEMYALPMNTIEGIVRVARGELPRFLDENGPDFDYGGQRYRVKQMAELLHLHEMSLQEGDKTVALLLVRAGERRVALAVDEVIGTSEVVVKAVGLQVSSVAGVTGATILPDGRVVVILDAPALAQARMRRALTEKARQVTAVAADEERPLVMVIDDSITMRRVAERTLIRNGFRVSTAKDGMDALGKLQVEFPAIVLLDIEMPRIDGFELATYMRNSDKLKTVPIIMITSRSGDKHRARAEQIGVERYMIKPYQEDELIQNIHELLARTGTVH